MSFTVEAKAQIVGAHQRSAGDTGSSEVQVALLTARISYLTEHLKANRNDKHTHYGLMKLVRRRTKLLSYLKRKKKTTHQSLVEKLGLRNN